MPDYLKATLIAVLVAPPALGQNIECGMQPSQLMMGGGGPDLCVTLQNAWTGAGGNNWHPQSFYVPGPDSDPSLGANDPNGYRHRPTATKTIEVTLVVWQRNPADGDFTPMGLNQIIDTEQNRRDC